MGKVKILKPKRKPFPLPDIPDGRQILLAIDPGTRYMGFSVIAFDRSIDHCDILEWGTIYGKGDGMAIAHSIMQRIDEIIERNNVTLMTCENYQFIPGKNRGMFVVPALIGILKYNWYGRTRHEVIMVPSQSWKTFITGKPSGNKADVYTCIQRFIPAELFTSILSTYEETRGERTTDVGQQDCLDALGIGIYIVRECIAAAQAYIEPLFTKPTRKAHESQSA